MKTTLAILSLLSLATPAMAAVVELAGYSVSPLFSAEVGLSVFATAFLSLLFATSYGPPASVRVRRTRPTGYVVAAPEAYSTRSVRRPVRRTRRAAAPVLTR